MNLVYMEVCSRLDHCLGRVWGLPWRFNYWEEPGVRRVQLQKNIQLASLLTVGTQAYCLKFVYWKRIKLDYVEP